MSQGDELMNHLSRMFYQSNLIGVPLSLTPSVSIATESNLPLDPVSREFNVVGKADTITKQDLTSGVIIGKYDIDDKHYYVVLFESNETIIVKAVTCLEHVPDLVHVFEQPIELPSCKQVKTTVNKAK